MAIGESLIRLVRRGDGDVDLRPDADVARVEAPAAVAAVEAPAEPVDLVVAAPFELPDMRADHAHEPGFADIEAAVELVAAGLARRVVLTSFPSWPGLLWRAYQLAEATNVLILPTVVRPGGRVDIVVTKEQHA